MNTEKDVSAEHLESGEVEVKYADPQINDSERRPGARGVELEEVPSSYWYSPLFLGSYAAICFGFTAAVGGFALIGGLLSYIDEDLGPSPYINWVGISFIVCQTIFSMVSGRLSDLFGRRWFFIVGSIIGLLGGIVGSTAQSVNQVIAAETLIGVSAGFQVSFFWVVSEIVPMNRRFLANSGIYLFSLPMNAFGPVVGLTIQQNTDAKWRGCFYLITAVSAVSVLCWTLFYHPPTFKMLYRTKTTWQMIKHLDIVGLLLFTAGLLLLLMGMEWGGGLYSWDSAHVIATLVSGAGGLILFTLWETFVPLEEPYLPLHLFRNLPYQAAAWVTSMGAMTYFAFTLIWPQAVARLYTDLTPHESAVISGLATMCFVLGQMSGPFLANWLPSKPLVIFFAITGSALLAAVAADPLNRSLTEGFLCTGILLLGMMEGIAIATTTFPLRSQEEIGTAGGLSGAIRTFGSAIGTVVYGTILTNRLATTVPALVAPAALQAGLPTASVDALIADFLGAVKPTAATVPGLSQDVLTAAQLAYQTACAQSYRTVFLSTLGFSGVAVIMAFFTKGLDKDQEYFVASRIHRTKDEKQLEAE